MKTDHLPRVLYDHQIFSFQLVGGISRYFTELITHLGTRGDVTPFLPFPLTVNEHLALAGLGKARVPFAANRWLRQATMRINRGCVQRAMLDGQYDIFHPTYYDSEVLRGPNHRPLVITVVDMIPELFPEQFAVNPHRGKRELVEASSAVIAISDRTKKDIIRLYNVREEKVHVIHLAAASQFLISELPSRPSKLPSRYLLFVGKRGRYKNFECFSIAAARILKKLPDLSLVCAGGGPQTEEECEPFVNAGVSKRLHFIGADESLLPGLYAHAEAFVFPSFYEGFGLPILESYGCRCPVALSNRSCFPEIGQSGAIYFDPSDPDSIYDSLERLTTSPALRRNLIEEGGKRLADFSWKKTARKTADVYRDVLNV